GPAGPGTVISSIWRIDPSGPRTRLRVNADHPAVQAVRAKLGDEAALVDSLLAVVAAAVPVDLLSQMAGAAPTALTTPSPTNNSVPPDVLALTRQVVARMRSQGITDTVILE